MGQTLGGIVAASFSDPIFEPDRLKRGHGWPKMVVKNFEITKTVLMVVEVQDCPRLCGPRLPGSCPCAFYNSTNWQNHRFGRLGIGGCQALTRRLKGSALTGH